MQTHEQNQGRPDYILEQLINGDNGLSQLQKIISKNGERVMYVREISKVDKIQDARISSQQRMIQNLVYKYREKIYLSSHIQIQTKSLEV